MTEKTILPMIDVPEQSKRKLRAIAEGIVNGQYYCDQHLPQEPKEQWRILVLEVFLPVKFGFLNIYKPETVGLLYSEVAKMVPGAVAGFPSFNACEVLNKADGRFVLQKVQKLLNAKKAGLSVVSDSETNIPEPGADSDAHSN